MSTIVQLTIDDLPLAACLGQHFYEEGNLPGKLIPAVFVASWTKLIQSGAGFGYALKEQGRFLGAIAGVVWPCPNDGELQANEMFWFVARSARGSLGSLRLLDSWERGARLLGARRLTMVHLEALSPAKLARHYERKGYSKLETNYMKEI